MTFCVDKEITFKPADKLIREVDGKEVDPESVPINVLSKNHWKGAEGAIAETVPGMWVDRDSLKASGVRALSIVLSELQLCYRRTCSSGGSSSKRTQPRTALKTHGPTPEPRTGCVVCVVRVCVGAVVVVVVVAACLISLSADGGHQEEAHY